MNAISADGFKPSDTAAGYINPVDWSRQVVNFLEEALVVTPLGRMRDDLLGRPGKSFYVTINSTPLAASATDNSADAVVSAYAVTQAEYTPSEFTFRYQLHDAEARRAFYDVQMDMAKKIGYAFALALDDDCVSTITNGAGNSIVANNVVASAVTTTDTIDFDDVVAGATEIRKDKLFPYALVVSAGQMGSLSKSTLFSQTLPQGGDVANVLGGKIGRIYGMDVYYTTQIAPTNNKSYALMLGQTASGDKPFGIGRKALPSIATQYFAAGRYLDIVGSAEWDVQTEIANGICKIYTYE